MRQHFASKLTFTFLVAGLTFVGCGPLDESDFAAEGDGTSIGQTAAAATTSYRYRCTCVSSQYGGVCDSSMAGDLRISAASARSNMGGQAAVSFARDRAYAPRGGNANYLRYNRPIGGGQQWILAEKELLTGGYRLRSGGYGAYAKLEARVDWWGSMKFICRRQ